MEISAPLVSVVMAVYNERPYVKEAVQSILRQTLSDFECMIVNDGSTDGTREVLERLADRDDRIRLIHQENLGLPTAVNRGLEETRGTYVARMVGDDISRPERPDRQVQFLSSHPEVGVVGTSAEYVDAEGEATGTTWHPPTDPDLISWKLLFNTCLCNPSTMIRRNLFDKVGDYACWAWPSEDYEWWTRACRVSRLTNLPSTLLKLRRHEGSVSVSERRKQIRKCAKAASNFHRALLGKEAENQMSAFLVWMSIEGIDQAIEETDIQDLSAAHEYLRALHRTHVRNVLSGGRNVVARQ
jgi:glycosyltransferase involved in cell wall biosynthesis